MLRSFSNLCSPVSALKDFKSAVHAAHAAFQPQNADVVSYLPSWKIFMIYLRLRMIYSAPVSQNSRMIMGHDLYLALDLIVFFSLTTTGRSFAVRNQNYYLNSWQGVEYRLMILIAIKPFWLHSMACPGDESEQCGRMLLLQDFSFAGFTSARTHFEGSNLGSTSKQNCSCVCHLGLLRPSTTLHPKHLSLSKSHVSPLNPPLFHDHAPYSVIHFQQHQL